MKTPIEVCIVCGSASLLPTWRHQPTNQKVHCNDCGTEVTRLMHERRQPETLSGPDHERLYAALTADYPAPWTLKYHRLALPNCHFDRQVARIVAADGTFPITLETHSGGDCFSLGNAGAEALVQFVNARSPKA